MLLGACALASLQGCGGSSAVAPAAPVSLLTPTVAVTPSLTTLSTAQSVTVSITAAGSGGTPTGSVALVSGSYASPATALNAGTATLTVAAGAAGG